MSTGYDLVMDLNQGHSVTRNRDHWLKRREYWLSQASKEIRQGRMAMARKAFEIGCAFGRLAAGYQS